MANADPNLTGLISGDQFDFSLYIREYDDYLLLDDDEAASVRLKYFNSAADMNFKRSIACAIIRHIIEDILGLKPGPSLVTQFGKTKAEMFRLWALTSDHDKVFSSYGFINFNSFENLYYPYLLHLCYPREIRFNYAREALQFYRDAVQNRKLVREGASVITKTRLSRMFFNGISTEDAAAVVTEFFRYFVTEIVKPQMEVSQYGTVHDIYRFFSDERRIRKLMRESGLLPILEDRAVTYYDLCADHMVDVCGRDDIFWRNVYSYQAALSQGKNYLYNKKSGKDKDSEGTHD